MVSTMKIVDTKKAALRSGSSPELPQGKRQRILVLASELPLA